MALGADWRFEAEASYLSDRHLLEEFFEKEFKEGKEQETVGYVRWIDGNAGAYVLERHRLNDFQTQLETLPRAHVLVDGVALVPDVLAYSGSADLAHLRLRPDEDAGLQSQRTWRGDALTELGLALDAGPVSLSPFGGLRATFWQDDLNGEFQERLLTTVGARAVTSLHGVHDVAWDLVGLDKLRHIAQLDVQIASTVSRRLDDDAALFRYDEVDALDRFTEVSIEFRHRFQTKVTEGDRKVTHEFMELGIEAERYLNPDRDTTAPNETNVASPFHWISLAPTSAAGAFESRDWSNLHWYLKVTPRAPFALSMAGEYNPVDTQEEAREIAVSARPMDGMSFSAGEVFLRNVTTAFTASLKWQITEKWGIDVSSQYDFEIDVWLKRRVVVVRDFHDFLFEVVFEDNESRDERKFYVTLVPKFIKRRDK